MRAPHRLRHPGRRGVAVIVIVVVALAAAGGWMAFRPTSSSAQAQPLPYTVAPTTVQQTVSASGTMSAAKEADLGFAASGTVTKVLVKVGDHVKKGQALARIDASTLAAYDNSAKAALSAAYQAYDSDTAAGAGSAQLSSDQAQIALSEASLSQAEDHLAEATLRSTIRGVVASRDLEVGDPVSSSSSDSSGSTSSSASLASSAGALDAASSSSSSSSYSSDSAFVVVKPGTFKAVADVSGDDISSVKKGMQVHLTATGSGSSSSGGGFGSSGQGAGPVESAPSGSSTTGSASGSSSSSTIFGTVQSVSMIADSSSSSNGFPVTIKVTGEHKRLYAGTSVTASIITKQLSNVLVVPAMALSSSGAKTYVEKAVGDRIVKTEVTVGQTFGAQTQITKGLSSGDTIQMATGFTRTASTTRSGGSSARGNFPSGGGLPSFGGGQ